MTGVLSWFSFATATTIEPLKNSSNNENTIESITLWLSVWKKWCLEKGIAKEIENYDPTHLDTFSSNSTPKLNQTWLNLANDDSISS